MNEIRNHWRRWLYWFVLGVAIIIISERLKDKLKDSIIHTEIYGSDHCPIELRMEI